LELADVAAIRDIVVLHVFVVVILKLRRPAP
jgi:hypothetical protein